MVSQEVPVELFGALHHPIHAEITGMLTSAAAKFYSQGSVGGKSENGLGEGIGVARRHQQSFPAVANDFFHAGDVRRDDGYSTCHGLFEDGGRGFALEGKK